MKWHDLILPVGFVIGVFVIMYTCSEPPRYSADPQIEALGVLKQQCLQEEWGAHWKEHWGDKQSVCVKPGLEYPDLNRADIFYREDTSVKDTSIGVWSWRWWMGLTVVTFALFWWVWPWFIHLKGRK